MEWGFVAVDGVELRKCVEGLPRTRPLAVCGVGGGEREIVYIAALF
jgi:hypothetical protein